MQFPKLFVSVLPLLSLVNSIPVEGITKRANKVYGVEFSVNRTSDSSLSKRAGSPLPDDITGEGTYYKAYFLFGSEKSKIGVTIDTGSSDLWVPNTNASTGQQYGVYDPSGSSTFKDTGYPFKITYADGTASTGEYVTDSLAFADGSGAISNFQFGSVGDTTVSTGGVLGLSVKGLEQVGSSPQYNNLPLALQSAGLISHASYSVYFSSAEATSGTLLFGGMDSSKYDGNTMAPFTFSGNAVTVPLDKFSINGTSTSVSSAMILDTGSTYSFLPTDAHSALVKQLGGDGSVTNGYSIVNCNPTGNLSYTFTSSWPDTTLTIDIPLSELVKGETENCYLTTKPGMSILGDDFLRHVYLGVNIESSYVWLAKPLYNTTPAITSFVLWGIVFKS
ncbi:candidapepsin [[Candida] railenensis]|uniref:Candidapepsin n=1 Tax=[Candida] railenensis TaxID=45579 RepID=A0A9P0QUG4_9ASCO|nr:candidapepsin [[Candida] railenensis]